MRRLSLIVVCLVLTASSFVARAQEEDTLDEEFELLAEEEVVFTASKHEQTISDSPATITVISRYEIENTHCTDVTCLLRQVPELEVRRVTPMYHSVGARALASELGDKVLVFVDGREVNVEAFGMPIWGALGVHLQEIERIEVVRGPGSALYGANAHSLVVAITTRSTDQNCAEAFAGAGEHDRSDVFAMVDRLFGPWRARASAAYDTMGHWRERGARELEHGRLSLRLTREWESGTSSLEAGFLRARGNVFTTVAPARLHDTVVGHAKLAHTSDWLRAHVWFNLFQADASYDLPLFFQGVKLGSVPEWMFMRNTTLDSEVQLNVSPFAGNLLLGGVNYRWLSMELEGNDPGLVHQHRVGVFLQDEQRLADQILLVGGVRFDWNSITPATFSPRLAVVWRPTPRHSARLAFGRAFRKPSFFNTSVHITTVEGTQAFPGLSDFFKRSIGNEDLENESVTSFEAGYRGRLLDGDLTVEADAFFNLYRDKIAFLYNIQYEMGLPDLADSYFRFENEGMEVNSLGGSISVIYRPDPSWRLAANYTFRHSWYVSKSVSRFYDAGDRVPWEPAHLANLSGSFVAPEGLRFGAALFVRSGFDEPWPEKGELFGGEELQRNPPGVIASAFAAWRWQLGDGWVEGGVRAFNLFGAGTRDFTAVTRSDGSELGGMLMSRLVYFFVRAGL